MSEAGQRRWIVDVLVMPKEGVNNPEGDAIKGGLASLGHDDVAQVRSGKYYRLWIAGSGPDQVQERAMKMADQVLANPVIQTFSIVSISAEQPAGSEA